MGKTHRGTRSAKPGRVRDARGSSASLPSTEPGPRRLSQDYGSTTSKRASGSFGDSWKGAGWNEASLLSPSFSTPLSAFPNEMMASASVPTGLGGCAGFPWVL